MTYYNTLTELFIKNKFDRCSKVFLSEKNKIPTVKVGNASESTVVCASRRVQTQGTISEGQTFAQIKNHKCATTEKGYHKFVSEPIEMFDVTAELQ